MRYTKCLMLCGLLILGVVSHNLAQSYSQFGNLKLGAYQVGFRVIQQYDYSRTVKPKTNWEGKSATGEIALPMQIGLWYPAKKTPKAALMRYEEYRWLNVKAENFGELTEIDKETALNNLNNILRNRSPENFNNKEVLKAILETQTAAIRDAEPESGKFPVIIGGLGNVGNFSVLAEYLASHGYVAASIGSHSKTFTLQVTQPQVAIEWQTRNIEYLLPFLRAYNFADSSRIGLIGANFDGMVVLNFQMRNQIADAIVSIDGWESKKGNVSTARQSPYFDVLKLRVPYLLFLQDKPLNEGLQFDSIFFNQLKYSERFFYQVKNIEHLDYLGNPLTFPTLAADKRTGVEFVYQNILHFFNSYLKKESQSLEFLKRNATENGFAKDLLIAETKLPALSPVPSAEEFEKLLKVGIGEDGSGIKQGIEIFRAAKKANPEVALFSLQSLRLFSFRMTQLNKQAEAVELLKLGIEAFPQSSEAINNLGNLYRTQGQRALAIECFEKALNLIAADLAVAEKDKESFRTEILKKLKELKDQK